LGTNGRRGVVLGAARRLTSARALLEIMAGTSANSIMIIDVDAMAIAMEAKVSVTMF